MPSRIVLALVLVSTGPGAASAWGPEGHAVTGILAMERIDPRARMALDALLGSTSPERMDELCNWPDAIQDLPEWAWAAPQHYVNLPRRAEIYDAQRDCPDGVCVTEAIKKYANQLMNDTLPDQRRIEAFAWLCHLVGDLHQPLHCAFADDRGGNRIDVAFRGETLNLHQLWDGRLIRHFAGDRDRLLAAVSPENRAPASGLWSPGEVDEWTMESFTLASTRAYPPAATIDRHFAAASWALIRTQLTQAGQRLARILNATLGDGSVQFPD